MRTAMLAVGCLVCGVGIANAQPGAYPPPQQPPPPQPQYPPPPYAYQPPQPQQVVLSADDAEILQRGEISDGQHLGGAAAAVFFGFGTGQAVQGRWTDTGWIFTVGESVATVAFVYGLVETIGDCGLEPTNGQGSCNDNRGALPLIGGMLALGGLRIGEIVDALVAPPRHNARLHDIQMRLGVRPQYGRVIMPYALPTANGGGTAGVMLRF